MFIYNHIFLINNSNIIQKSFQLTFLIHRIVISGKVVLQERLVAVEESEN